MTFELALCIKQSNGILERSAGSKHNIRLDTHDTSRLFGQLPLRDLVTMRRHRYSPFRTQLAAPEMHCPCSYYVSLKLLLIANKYMH